MYTFLRKNKLRIKGISTIVLLVAFVLIAYFFSSGLIRFLSIAFISIGLLAFFIYCLALFVTSEKGSKFAYTWSEIAYSLIGVPVLLLSIFYLPVSLYFVFVNSFALSTMIKSTLMILMILFQLISFSLFIIRIIRDRDVKKDDIFEIEFASSIDLDYVFSPIK